MCYRTGNTRLPARPVIIQPGNCTGWGSEGVKQTDKDVDR